MDSCSRPSRMDAVVFSLLPRSANSGRRSPDTQNAICCWPSRQVQDEFGQEDCTGRRGGNVGRPGDCADFAANFTALGRKNYKRRHITISIACITRLCSVHFHRYSNDCRLFNSDIRSFRVRDNGPGIYSDLKGSKVSKDLHPSRRRRTRWLHAIFVP